MSIVEGIAESVASELLRAMFETGLLKKNTILEQARKKALIGQRLKEVDRYAPSFTLPDEIAAWPTVIEEAVLLKPERSYVGAPPETVARSQMNNRRAKNTRDGMKALEHENKTPYTLDIPMLGLHGSRKEGCCGSIRRR